MEGFDPETVSLIGGTTLGDLIERNADTPKLQADVFFAAPLPNRVRSQATPSAVTDTEGHRLPVFINDGM